MNSSELQIRIFQYIKGVLPSNVSMVDEVASVLQQSTDSAYRRIRAEKPLSLEELSILCTHFQISLDQLLSLKSDAFLFSGSLMDPTSFRFDQWLKLIAQH